MFICPTHKLSQQGACHEAIYKWCVIFWIPLFGQLILMFFRLILAVWLLPSILANKENKVVLDDIVISGR